jgi:hypothetical protein
MLRCTAFFVIAAYFYVRLIPQNLCALPANFLRNHRIFELFTSPSKLKKGKGSFPLFLVKPVSSLSVSATAGRSAGSAPAQTQPGSYGKTRTPHLVYEVHFDFFGLFSQSLIYQILDAIDVVNVVTVF